MTTVKGIIDAMGGFRAVAEAVRVPKGTASAWKTRGTIPPAHWRDLVAEARRREIASVTLEALADAHARPEHKAKPQVSA